MLTTVPTTVHSDTLRWATEVQNPPTRSTKNDLTGRLNKNTTNEKAKKPTDISYLTRREIGKNKGKSDRKRVA